MGYTYSTCRAFMSRKRGEPGQMKIERSGCEKSRSVGNLPLGQIKTQLPSRKHCSTQGTREHADASIAQFAVDVLVLSVGVFLSCKSGNRLWSTQTGDIRLGLFLKKTQAPGSVRMARDWGNKPSKIWGRTIVGDLTLTGDQVHVSHY